MEYGRMVAPPLELSPMSFYSVCYLCENRS